MPRFKSKFIAAIVFTTLAALPHTMRADGAAVYKGKCVACHGADGSGNTPVGKNLKLRNLGSADVQKMSDAELTTVITDGKGKMPAYGKKLSADEIKSLVGCIRAFKK
ncbi:MAG: cytochrome c, class [Acidobacteria bacterium]|nr:cytochrome c, class [Acidobacteriota bacterium]